MEYVDFEIRVDAYSDREGLYPVAVVRSPAGEAATGMRFPFDTLALESRLKDLQIALLRTGGRRRHAGGVEQSPEGQSVRTFGIGLFEALFSGPIRGRYAASRERAERDGQRLRLKLRIQAPELAALPWEYLYDPDQGEYVCLSHDTPLVRYLDLPRAVPALTIQPPLRVLAMIASPSDLPRLDSAREKERVERAVAGLPRGVLELVWLEGQTWRAVQRAMRAGPWHVFHFIGHGGFSRANDEGYIALTGDDGRAHELGAPELGRLLAGHDPLRLVLLNACAGARAGVEDVFSSTAATLVRRGIPAVVAMQYEITDGAAIEFARAFYEAVADGLPVDAAVVEARVAVSIAIKGTVEWGTPVLFMRSENGVLFDLKKGAAPIVPAAPPAATVAPSSASATAPLPPAGDAVASSSGPGPEPGPSGTAAVLPPPPVGDASAVDDLYDEALAAYWTQQWERAIAAFERIIAVQPGYDDAATKLAEARRQLQLATGYDRGMTAVARGDWPAAIRELEAVVALAPGYRDADEQLAAARQKERLADLYDEARRLSQGQQWRAVVNVFARIAAEQADYPDPEGLLAAAQATLAAAEQAERLDRLYRRGLRHLNAGAWEEAYSALAEVQRLDAGFRQTGALLAQVNRSLSERRQARLHLLGVLQSRLLERSAVQAVAAPAPLPTTSPRRPARRQPSQSRRITPATVERLECKHLLQEHGNTVRSVAFSPDGTLLTSGSHDKTVCVWRTGSGKLVKRLEGHTDWVQSVAFSPDGTLLASAADDRTIRIWSTADWTLAKTLEGHGDYVMSVAFSPDGTLLASGSNDRTVRLWRTADWQHIRSFEGHGARRYMMMFNTFSVTSVAFSPDGTLLASGAADHEVRLWRVADGKSVNQLKGHIGWIWGVAFAPDGATVASASEDCTVRLWSVTRGASLVRTLKVDTWYQFCVAFSPDGALVATGGNTGSLRLWSASDGALLQAVQGVSGDVQGVAFSPDGRLLASGGSDNTVRLWGLKSA